MYISLKLKKKKQKKETGRKRMEKNHTTILDKTDE